MSSQLNIIVLVYVASGVESDHGYKVNLKMAYAGKSDDKGRLMSDHFKHSTALWLK